MHVIEDRQVKALGDLATKRDLEELRVSTTRDIAELRTELKHDITLLESKLTHRMTLGFIAVGALSLASPHLPNIISFTTSMMKRCRAPSGALFLSPSSYPQETCIADLLQTSRENSSFCTSNYELTSEQNF